MTRTASPARARATRPLLVCDAARREALRALHARSVAAGSAALALLAIVEGTRHDAWLLRTMASERRSLDAASAVTRRSSDRVVRHASHANAAGEAEGEPHPREHWAHAPVYATRTLVEGEADGVWMPDEARRAWTVREIDTRALVGARAARCLVFENHDVVRRVWEFPPDWTSLPAAELLRLAGLP